jgi:hypothetical protein
VQEPGQERRLDVAPPHARDLARPSRGRRRVRAHRVRARFVSANHEHRRAHRRRDGDVAERGQSESTDRLRKRHDRLTRRVRGGVRDAQHVTGERRIVLDELGELSALRVRIATDREHARRDVGHQREFELVRRNAQRQTRFELRHGDGRGRHGSLPFRLARAARWNRTRKFVPVRPTVMTRSSQLDPESARLRDDALRTHNWKRFGPYLSERQWGTVREDYSANGDCWSYFPHDHARSRAYRWGEDGLLGITDRQCRVCFAVALWNERDPILKERLFGLSNPEGNHGEDVKEQYFYLESTPTHSYMRALYKYPQAEFPYSRLVTENSARSRKDPEFELDDTDVFENGRYFDVFVEYAKNAPDDVLIRVHVHNRGDAVAPLHVLPTLWFRNAWSWAARRKAAPCARARAGVTTHSS